MFMLKLVVSLALISGSLSLAMAASAADGSGLVPTGYHTRCPAGYTTVAYWAGPDDSQDWPKTIDSTVTLDVSNSDKEATWSGDYDIAFVAWNSKGAYKVEQFDTPDQPGSYKVAGPGWLRVVELCRLAT